MYDNKMVTKLLMGMGVTTECRIRAHVGEMTWRELVWTLVGKQCNRMKQQVVVGGNMTSKCSEQNFVGESFCNCLKVLKCRERTLKLKDIFSGLCL